MFIPKPLWSASRASHLSRDSAESFGELLVPFTLCSDASGPNLESQSKMETPVFFGLMNRRSFLKAIGLAALLPILPRRLLASTNFRRRRPSDATWPSQSVWKQLNDAVGGNLIPADFPLSLLKTDPTGAAAKLLAENIRNPYYIGDQPGLTQTLGWVDAWATKPSVYAVAA